MKFSEAIAKFENGGLIPWTKGYTPYKHRLIEQTMNSPELMSKFRDGSALPTNFGAHMDERVVEYPWVFSRLNANARTVLDAGSTFSKDFLLEHASLKDRRLIIYTLMTDWITLNPNVSYMFGDFREMLLKDECVDAIASISTLEHCGMGQDYRLYNSHNLAPDQDLTAYRSIMSEFYRVLKPGGQFLLTVPYGKRENHGWLQQFDVAALEDLIQSFGGDHVLTTFYRYDEDGWHLATADDCRESSYFNLHASDGFDADYAAAARAVACVELRK